MKKLLSLFLIIGALSIFSGATCKPERLEVGGAYAQTNAVPDLQFYVTEQSFVMAYTIIDTAFKFERDNRKALWKLSPMIKQTLDNMRPDATKARNDYITARKVYQANPTPAGLSKMETYLAKLNQIAVTAQAAIGK